MVYLLLTTSYKHEMKVFSMKKVMLGDRLFGRAKQMEFIFFDKTSRENEFRVKNWDANLQKAYEIGKGLFHAQA